MKFWVNFVSLDFPVSQVSRVSFFKVLYSFWCSTL